MKCLLQTKRYLTWVSGGKQNGEIPSFKELVWVWEDNKQATLIIKVALSTNKWRREDTIV